MKEVLPYISNCKLFGDKAYGSQEVEQQLEAQNVKLFCPEKNVKGESIWERQFNFAFRKAYGRAVSSVRQPIESFFNWIIEKTGIQNASKVRSKKGLIVHIFGKLSAALVISIGF